MSSRLSAKLTIGEVNSFLTDLYTSVDAEVRKWMFRDLIYRASPLEIKWIIKIILKDMKIGVGVESILRHLHPNAIQLYHISNSLQHVLNSISGGNGSSPGSPSGQTSIYFQPIKPMLSERVNPGDIPEKFSRMHGSMLLEPKIDGERMLVHVDKRKGSVVIYSRNGVNFTKKYGDNQLSPIIFESFKGLGAVFDGEMVAWDPHRGRIHAFGTNREIASGATDAAINAETQQNDDDGDIIGTNGDGNLFYIIFDLIYYVDIDGELHDLRNTPLEDRRDLLDRVLLPVPHRVEVIKTQRCSGESLVDDIKEFLKKALEKREEGVVVKRANSEYKLNIRGMGWYKIKAEFDLELEKILLKNC
jgi:DNA ligase-4